MVLRYLKDLTLLSIAAHPSTTNEALRQGYILLKRVGDLTCYSLDALLKLKPRRS